MAVSTAATVALSSSSIAACPSDLSSCSSRSWSAPRVVVSAPAARKTAGGQVTVRAASGSSSEEPKSARREILASLVAAGAALAVAGSSIAAAGPGNDGAAITAKQADELLKAGDDLTKNDSPPRFGGERAGEQAIRNADKVAQQAGSGAVEGLQNNSDSAASAIDVAKQNVEKAGDRLGDLFKPNKSSGDVSSSNPLDDAGSKIKGGVEDLLNNGPQKVKSDVDTASSKVRNDVATTKGAVEENASGTANKSGNVLDKAQEKLKESVKGFSNQF